MLELEQGRAEFENFRWRYFIVRIQDLIIDPRSLGEKYWLVEVSPAYEYKDNRRTDSITGYRYSIALPEKGLEKINVKIDGPQLLDTPDGFAEVKFDALEVYIYWSNGQPQVGARATGVHLVNAKS